MSGNGISLQKKDAAPGICYEYNSFIYFDASSLMSPLYLCFVCVAQINSSFSILNCKMLIRSFQELFYHCITSFDNNLI